MWSVNAQTLAQKDPETCFLQETQEWKLHTGCRLYDVLPKENGAAVYKFPDLSRCQHRSRPQSRSFESQTAGLQSLWLASRLKPWLRTIDGLRWLMATNQGYGYKEEIERQQISTVTSVYLIIMSNPTPRSLKIVGPSSSVRRLAC